MVYWYLFCIFLKGVIVIENTQASQKIMKRQFHQIVVLSTFLVLGVAAGAMAQDAGMSDNDVAGVPAEAGGQFSTGEDIRYAPRATGIYAPTDSVMLQMQDFPMQRAAQKAVEKQADKPAPKKDDSILTFNFLYYIIQKYKLQDIID